MSAKTDNRTTDRHTSRKRLIQAGGALAKQSGFAGTGLDTLAGAADLTSGAFYAHFRAKADLLDAIVEHDMQAMVDSFDAESPASMRLAMKRYLSMRHAENPALGCAIPALGAEIARAGLKTRESFETHMLRLQTRFADLLGNQEQAWTLLSQAIGAQVIARALASPAMQKELLDAVLQDALTRMPAEN